MIEFKIPQMTCGGCARAVTSLLREGDPAAKVDIDLAKHLVHVETHQDRELLAQALTDAGYPAVD